MKVNKKNINRLDDFRLHDSELVEVCLKYDDNIMTVVINHFHLKNKVTIIFKEVLYTEMTNIKLWGGGDCILDWELNENDKMLENFIQMQDKELQSEFVVWSKLTEVADLNDFFSLSFVLNSGDKITTICNEIICEDID
ncbi:hypothetical protein [Clostridium sp. HBUAS56017]|uniref:hypothetical protein n=1 Tax=Clostridium sp. HBUAS56017 TaxID=2571128 RepID=UPI0011782ADA|nr:hypothetical protein [Clostridium sp. HBUAS56017]